MATWGELSPEQQGDIARRYLDGVSADVLAAEYDIKASSLGRLLRRKRDKLAAIAERASAAPSFPVAAPESGSYLEAWQQKRAAEQIGWRELVEHALKGAQLHQTYRPTLLRARRVIITDKPVFLVHASDFHLGSPYTDYQSFVQTSDLILNDPRFYLNIVGPDLETAFAWFRSAEAVLNQVLPPYLQLELYRQWLDVMLPRTVAVCGDNHTDERLETYLGDIGLKWREDVPYFRAFGLLTLAIGPDHDHLVEYEFLEAHRYRGSSIYHDLQPVLRMMRDIYPLADCYVTGHTHVPAYHQGVFYPEARLQKPSQHFIITGTFKTGGDVYSLRNFGGSGLLGLPTLQLWPDEYRIQYYESPLQALVVNRSR